MQFGVRFPYDPATYDLDLYVYDSSGDEIAASAYGDENAESVVLPSLPNGTYTVEVHPYTVGKDVAFEGLVEVEYLPAVQPLRDLLPNLTVQPQRNVTFDFDGSVVGDLTSNSCAVEEFAEQGARRCLRFEQIISNEGDGPAEIRYDFVGPGTVDQSIFQRIYRSDGTYWERHADKYVFHAAHAHFHYANFALSRLWASNAGGARLGTAPVREGRKNGFCLIDVENFAFGRKGDAARRYTSCLPADEMAEGTGQTNGISVGWADVYNWYLADQYIEVTGVPDGFYLLETIVDPATPASTAGTLLETDETDNAVEILVRICGDRAGLASADPCAPERK